MDDIKEKIKQALRHIWTNKYRLFLCLLTLCCLFGLIHYFKSADSATASRKTRSGQLPCFFFFFLSLSAK